MALRNFNPSGKHLHFLSLLRFGCSLLFKPAFKMPTSGQNRRHSPLVHGLDPGDRTGVSDASSDLNRRPPPKVESDQK